MTPKLDNSRRFFLQTTTAFGTGLVVTGFAKVTQARSQDAGSSQQQQQEKVVPPEDLMREHGVIRRILLIYDEGIRRINTKEKDFQPEVFANAAKIIRNFAENYHEKLEENYIFPRFEKAGQQVDLIKVLRQQHQAGRQLTNTIVQLATIKALTEPQLRMQLAEAMRQFVQMYQHHAAREDTVLFPKFQGLVTPQEYDALGEQFEDLEHKLFGEDGFNKVVDQVASLEKALGIYDLAQFTPSIKTHP